MGGAKSRTMAASSRRRRALALAAGCCVAGAAARGGLEPSGSGGPRGVPTPPSLRDGLPSQPMLQPIPAALRDGGAAEQRPRAPAAELAHGQRHARPLAHSSLEELVGARGLGSAELLTPLADGRRPPPWMGRGPPPPPPPPPPPGADRSSLPFGRRGGGSSGMGELRERPRSLLVAYALWLLSAFGTFGLHHVYLGHDLLALLRT